MHWLALQPQPDEAPDFVLSHGLAALGWWALQYTPRVSLQEEAVLLEVSSSERLWGGRRALLRHIEQAAKPVSRLSYAQGATSLLAWARLQVPDSARSAPDALPLSALVAARTHLPTLARLGCTRWGQLRALPRDGVARRFGAALLDALDQAYGLQPESHRWLLLPEVFEAKLELLTQVETAPALLFAARRLLQQLQLWLQLRHRGVLALELGWTMDARRNTATQGELLLRTAEPTQDITHLQRLLTEHLAQLSLAAPAQYLHLRTLETQALAGHSASLLPDEQITGDSLQQMLERLSARLGPQQVLHLQACADHRPEHMQSWQSATDAKALTAASNTSSKLTKSNLMKTSINHDNRLAAVRAEPGQSALRQAQGERCCVMKPSALYPSWLLAQPLKLTLQAQRPQYHGPLSLLAGPQRLETGWWGGGTSALRDYFVARNPQQTLLWIFRERLPPHGATNDSAAHWYLHGFFA